MSDLIDRQAAIDAHYEYCNKHPDAGFPVWSLKILEDLPTAQPELCEGAVSRRRLLSDLKELIAAWEKYPVMAEQIKGVEAAIGYVESIPSAQPEHTSNNDCNGCKFVGCYDTDFPCANCIRKNKDYYAPERKTDEKENI